MIRALLRALSRLLCLPQPSRYPQLVAQVEPVDRLEARRAIARVRMTCALSYTALHAAPCLSAPAALFLRRPENVIVFPARSYAAAADACIAWLRSHSLCFPHAARRFL